MTIGEAATFYDTVKASMPDKLSTIYTLQTQKKTTVQQEALEEAYKELNNADMRKHFPRFYGICLEALSDIPSDVMERVLWDDRTATYKQMAEHFVLGMMFGDYSQIENIKEIEFNEETLLLPITDKVLNMTIPMAGEPIITFTEAADLQIYSEDMAGGKFGVAANIVSILCRPEGEAYNEKVSLKRAEGLKELTMDKVWEVFFCITQQVTISKQNTLISSLEARLNRLKEQNEAGQLASVGTAE